MVKEKLAPLWMYLIALALTILINSSSVVGIASIIISFALFTWFVNYTWKWAIERKKNPYFSFWMTFFFGGIALLIFWIKIKQHRKQH